ncbi:hypothetical protein [Armatimonas sp.]|uniref:hypothetical protein n=1 Tax=Armatimonas sp. TaxID=1872638 RepID=UPI00286AD00E|nr:hypothetical protein [Armatimonas sp.]
MKLFLARKLLTLTLLAGAVLTATNVKAQVLYVSNFLDVGNKVTAVDNLGGSSVFASGPDLAGASGLAFSGTDLYVATWNGRLHNITGGVISPALATGLGNVFALAFDASGNAYTAANNGNVMKTTPLGVTSVFASGFGSNQGLAFLGNDLYVSSAQFGTVSKVTPGGVVSTYASGLGQARAMTFDPAGNLYVTQPADGSGILKVPLGGGSFSAFGSLSGVGGGYPTGLTFFQDELYVADYTGSRIVKFTSAGGYRPR